MRFWKCSMKMEIEKILKLAIQLGFKGLEDLKILLCTG